MKQAKTNLTNKAQVEVTNYTVGNLTNNTSTSTMAKNMQSEATQNLTNSLQNEAIANLNNEVSADKAVNKYNKKSHDQQNGMF